MIFLVLVLDDTKFVMKGTSLAVSDLVGSVAG
jgi:hypothetical protein